MRHPSPTDAAAVEGESVGAGTGPLEGLVTRNFITLGSGELLARLIGFGVTIYVARQLGVEAYGVIGFAFALMLYASAVADLGIEQLGPREVAEPRAPLDALVGSVLVTRIAVSGVLSAVLALFGVLVLTQPEGNVLALFGLTLLAAGANAKWVHVGFDRTRVVSIVRLLAESAKVIVVVLFVRGPDDLLLVPAAYVLGDMLAALVLLVAMRRYGVRRLHFDRAIVVDIFRRARPLLYTNLLALLIYNADVVLLRIFRDRTEVGLYLAAYTLINFIGVLGNITTLSMLPTLSRLRTSPREAKLLHQTALARVFAIGLPIAVGGTLLAPRILGLVFGDAYARSSVALAVLIWSIPPLLLRSVAQAALISAERQSDVLRTTAWAAVVNVGLNLGIVPLFGMIGAACTTVLAELVRLLLAHRYAHSAGFATAQSARFARPLAAAAGMAAVLVLLPATPVWLTVPLGAIVYGILLTLLGGIRYHEGSLALRV